MKTISLLLFLGIVCDSYLDAQVIDTSRAYPTKKFLEMKALPYDNLREADVMWEKRIWRVIDTREKMNKSFVYPREPFVSVLQQGATEGYIEAYNDEDFSQRLTGSELLQKFRSIDTAIVFNDETYSFDTFIYENQLDPESVTKFRVKEDWIFDEETSTLIVRIIGMSPVRDVYDDDDNFLGEEPLFWIHYPSCRDYLANKAVFNERNRSTSSLLSWEQTLEQRIFTSYIMKESNVYDRRISDYMAGVDMILEAEKIHEDIRRYEHELWSY